MGRWAEAWLRLQARSGVRVDHGHSRRGSTARGTFARMLVIFGVVFHVDIQKDRVSHLASGAPGYGAVSGLVRLATNRGSAPKANNTKFPHPQHGDWATGAPTTSRRTGGRQGRFDKAIRLCWMNFCSDTMAASTHVTGVAVACKVALAPWRVRISQYSVLTHTSNTDGEICASVHPRPTALEPLHMKFAI